MVTQTGSGQAGSSQTRRGSVKDRLGPVGPGGRAGLPGGSPPRRRLFTPSSSRSQSKRHREEGSRDYSELPKQQKIQKVKEALDALRSQQEEWAAELAELEKQEEVQPVRKTGSRARHAEPGKQEEARLVRRESRAETSGSRALEKDGRRRVPNQLRDTRTQVESTHSSPAQYRGGQNGGSAVSRGCTGHSSPAQYREGQKGGSAVSRGVTRRTEPKGKAVCLAEGDAGEHGQPGSASDPVLKRLKELEDQLAELKAVPMLVDSKSPFSAAINLEKADPKRKIPPLESYDGTGDPYDHTNAYEIIMGYYGHTEAGLCKIFVTTLKKAAKQWVVSLPSGSISSWADLSQKFHDRFGSNRRRGKLTASLMQIKQKGTETLGQYVQRFRDAVGRVTDLDVTQALGFFTTGLDLSRSKKLMKEIMFKPPKDLADAYERAENFIAIEEAMSALHPVQRYADRPKAQEPREDVWNRIGNKDEKQMEKRPFRPSQESKAYTPLNTNRVQILEEMKGKSYFEPATPSMFYGKNQNAFCDYHKSVGHSTEGCRELKDLIEKNVQNGRLLHYLTGREAPRDYRSGAGEAPRDSRSGDRAAPREERAAPRNDNCPRRVVD